MKIAYLDHQATTPLEPEVEAFMRPFWGELFGNPHSTEHLIGLEASQAVDHAQMSIASTLSCEADEIIFTSGATEANNHAIFGVCSSPLVDVDRKRVIISAIEHKCVQEAAKYWTSTFGLELQIVSVDKNGYVNLEELEQLLRTPTRLVSIMAVNNEIGTIQNLEEISSLIWEAGAIFHSDCAQALKAMPTLEVGNFADIASFSGHKIGGPQGVGACYISADLHGSIPPLILGGGQQNGMRAGTVPLSLVAGLGKAFELRLDSEKVAIELKKTKNIRDQLFNKLTRALPNIELNGPPLTERHPANLNIRFPSKSSSELLAQARSVLAASSGSACSSGSIQASHVLRAIGLGDVKASESVRFSVSSQTTKIELDQAVATLTKAINSLT